MNLKHSAAMLAILATAASSAKADFLGIGGDIGGFLEQTIEEPIEDLGQLAEDGLKGVVTPLKIIEDTLVEGKSLDQSLSEALDDAKAAVVAVAQTPTILNHSYAALAEVAGDALGEGAGDVVGIVLLPTAVANSLPAAVTAGAISATEGVDNLDNLVGIPLAALLSHVIQVNESGGQPIPESIRVLLEPTFGAEHLAQVRYVVHDETSDLAGLLNTLNTMAGSGNDNHAVTAGQLIVFDREPSHSADDLFFWAHEVQHTVQYARMGVDGFAAEYTTNYGGLEDEADAVAQQAVENAQTWVAAQRAAQG